MVGKLSDMVTAAVVVDSTPKVKSSDAQSQNVTAQAQPVEKAPSQSSMLKLQDVKQEDLLKKGEDDKKQKEDRLKPGTMSEEAVSQMTEAFNKLMSKINCNLEFSYNKEVDLFNVKMIDKETKKVIKEFPPEEMIENMIKSKEWLGAFIDRMA